MVIPGVLGYKEEMERIMVRGNLGVDNVPRDINGGEKRENV